MAQLGVSSLISMKLEATSKNPEPVALRILGSRVDPLTAQSASIKF